MRLEEAKELARLLKAIPSVTIVGVKTVDGEKALVISINRTGRIQITNPDNAVGKVAKRAGVHGQTWERLNVCSLCYRKLRSNDGHCHSITNSRGAAEGVCCRCVRRSGAKCLVKRVA